MERTSIYWGIRGTLKEASEKLLKYEKEDLVHLLVNTRYNQFVSNLANYDDDEKPQDPTLSSGTTYGKRVPYIGWFWRNVDFSRKELPIGDTGEFIGFIANNKWDYPQRLLTEGEANKVIEIIELAMREDEKGGSVKEIREKTRAELEKLWGYLQTLKVSDTKE